MHISKIVRVFDWHDKKMHRNVRFDILNDRYLIIAIHEIRLQLTGQNFTEHVVNHRYLFFNRFFNSSIIFSNGIVS